MASDQLSLSGDPFSGAASISGGAGSSEDQSSMPLLHSYCCHTPKLSLLPSAYCFQFLSKPAIYGHRLQYVPFYDASTPYFSNNHKPFMILAIVMFTVFNLLPLLFLLLNPLKIVQRCLGRLPLRCVSFLNTFADAFQGCYKNGTGGTADCRYFAGLYLVFRVVLFPQSYMPYYFSMPLQVLTCVVIAMLFVTIRLYKAQFYTHLDAWSFIFVGIVYVYIWFETFSDNIHLPQMPVYIAYAIPAVYILTYCPR